MFNLNKNYTFLRIPIPKTLFTHNKSYFSQIKKKNFKELREEYVQSQIKTKVSSEIENEYYKKVFQDITKFNRLIRFPIYVAIIPLILMSPLSSSFSILLYSEIFYLISLSCLEGASFFSLGLYSYKSVILKDINDQKEKMVHLSVNRKRIFLPIFYFGLMFISLSFLNTSMINGSLYTLMFGHIYMYFKYALQLVYKVCPETIIYNSMSFLLSKTIILILILLIYKSKTRMINRST